MICEGTIRKTAAVTCAGLQPVEKVQLRLGFFVYVR